MADIRYERATRIYPGTDVPAVDALDLHVADGELMVLVGPSGSGKSTALRMLAGLEDVDEGGIWIGDRDVTYERPRDRDVAMVFQSYALYPYLSVAQNIAFPLKMARVKREERDRRVRQVAELLGLDRAPRAQARAALRRPAPARRDGPGNRPRAEGVPHGRAALEPRREAPRPDARRHRRLQARLAVTTVYVTHDQSEAMTLGSRVAVLRDGRLQQCAPPRELYERPANAFVAGFIGSPAMSLIEVALGTNGSVDLGGVGIPLPDETRVRGGGPWPRAAARRAPSGGAAPLGRRHPGARRGRRGARRRRLRLLLRRRGRCGSTDSPPGRTPAGRRGAVTPCASPRTAVRRTSSTRRAVSDSRPDGADGHTGGLIVNPSQGDRSGT